MSRHVRPFVAAVLSAVVWSGALLLAFGDDKARLLETRECAGCQLQEVSLTRENLKGVNVRYADFSKASLYRADFTGADLRDARFVEAALMFADLTNANLAGADLSGANLRGAVGANFTGAKTSAETMCPDGTAGPCR